MSLKLATKFNSTFWYQIFWHDFFQYYLKCFHLFLSGIQLRISCFVIMKSLRVNLPSVLTKPNFKKNDQLTTSADKKFQRFYSSLHMAIICMYTRLVVWLGTYFLCQAFAVVQAVGSSYQVHIILLADDMTLSCKK